MQKICCKIKKKLSHCETFDPNSFQNYIPLGLMGVAKINKRLPIVYKCTLLRPKVMVSVTKMDGITKQAFWRHYGLKFFQKEYQNYAVAFFLVMIFFMNILSTDCETVPKFCMYLPGQEVHLLIN